MNISSARCCAEPEPAEPKLTAPKLTAYGLPDWSKMPKAASGGFVASSGMAVIHRGETVTPAGRAAAVGTQDNSRFELVLDSGERLTGLMRRIASQEAAAQSLADRRVGAMR